MPREKLQLTVLEKIMDIQNDSDKPVWMSGKQITELLHAYNPSSVRMALLFLHDKKLVIRERKKGRGPKGKTGQSAWYVLQDDEVVLERGIEELRTAIIGRGENESSEETG